MSNFEKQSHSDKNARQLFDAVASHSGRKKILKGFRNKYNPPLFSKQGEIDRSAMHDYFDGKSAEDIDQFENEHTLYLLTKTSHREIYVPTTSDILATLVRKGEQSHRPTTRQLFIENSGQCIVDTQDVFVIRGQDNEHALQQNRAHLKLAANRFIGVAATFKSWSAGNDKTEKVEDGIRRARPSGDVINDYASGEAPIPSLDVVNSIMTTDGYLYHIAAAGAHRAAAALHRQQTSIETKQINIYPTNHRSDEIENWNH